MKDVKKILYITYIDMNNASSGSHVRPRMMLKCMKELGYEVIELTGDQTGDDRLEKIHEAEAAIRSEKPDICYIESPTYPIMKHADRAFIGTVHDMGIPVGYFYRDFYRKFPLKDPKGRSLSRRVKDFGLDRLQEMTDKALNACDIVYFPSAECSELFSYKDMRPLPPAGTDLLPGVKEVNHTCIYVGGITGHYNGKLLFDAFKELHKRDSSYKLILVCREAEWAKFEHACKEAEWVSVHHTSGDGLLPLYDEASLSLIIHSDNAYNKYAIPVKTFEYMSHGLPIVSVDIKALGSFIRNEGIGEVVSPEPEAFADGVQKILGSVDTYKSYADRVQTSLLERNLWKHRVETIVSDLGELR
jgi:glycosyltransferase involved in cell wall biosynthesis